MAKQSISSKIRLLIAERAQNRCEYCQCRSDCACESFEGEHILQYREKKKGRVISVSKGGSNESDNLAFYLIEAVTVRKSDRQIIANDIILKELSNLFPFLIPDWKIGTAILHGQIILDYNTSYHLGLTPIRRTVGDTGRATSWLMLYNSESNRRVVNLPICL